MRCFKQYPWAEPDTQRSARCKNCSKAKDKASLLRRTCLNAPSKRRAEVVVEKGDVLAIDRGQRSRKRVDQTSGVSYTSHKSNWGIGAAKIAALARTSDLQAPEALHEGETILMREGIATRPSKSHHVLVFRVQA
jgi:hypothetical protein